MQHGVLHRTQHQRFSVRRANKRRASNQSTEPEGSRSQWSHTLLTHFRKLQIYLTRCCLRLPPQTTSQWSIGTCVRLGAGRSRVRRRSRVSAGSYQDLVNWYCSLLARRTVCRGAARNTRRTFKQTRNCTVVALQDHCSYTAPTTNHHIKKATIRTNYEFSNFYTTMVTTGISYPETAINNSDGVLRLVFVSLDRWRMSVSRLLWAICWYFARSKTFEIRFWKM